MSQAASQRVDFERFDALHRDAEPLLLANIWDAASAALCQQAGARALATGSAALAWARGYADGRQLPAAELLAAVSGIRRVTKLPLSVDVENGYSDDPAAVAGLVKELVALGVVGINLEDGDDAPQLLADKIRAIRAALGDTGFYINARTDVYLRQLCLPENALDETLKRLALYRDAGASGVFVPTLVDWVAAQRISGEIALPLNLMLFPELPDWTQLCAAGVSRISAGPAMFLVAYSAGERAMRRCLSGDLSLESPPSLNFPGMNQLFNG